MNWPRVKKIMGVGKWESHKVDKETWHEAEDGKYKAWKRYGFFYLLIDDAIHRGDTWEDVLKGAGYDCN